VGDAAAAAYLDGAGRDVERDDVHTVSLQREGSTARAGADVEDSVAQPRAQPPPQRVIGDEFEVVADVHVDEAVVALDDDVRARTAQLVQEG
jgi:hypothetical protein